MNESASSLISLPGKRLFLVFSLEPARTADASALMILSTLGRSRFGRFGSGRPRPSGKLGRLSPASVSAAAGRVFVYDIDGTASAFCMPTTCHSSNVDSGVGNHGLLVGCTKWLPSY